MYDLYLLPHIIFPTRFKNRSATLSDQIYTKLSTTFKVSQSYIPKNQITVHHLLLLIVLIDQMNQTLNMSKFTATRQRQQKILLSNFKQ